MDHAEQKPRVPSRGSFDTASLLGACGWWPPPTSVVTTADFTGCGATTTGDPFSSRTSICGRSQISPSHLSLSQPRRIVEEVLGHLYAKPPSAERQAETETSGIHDSQPATCKTVPVPSPDVNSQILNSVNVINPESGEIPGKISENSVVNNVSTSLPTVLSVPVISSCPSKSKKSESNRNSSSSGTSAQQKNTSRRKKLPKVINETLDGMKNGKMVKPSNSRHKSQTNRKPKEKTSKHLSSDSESHGESTSSSGAESTSGCASASSGSSDSTDEEEREKQQQELARLKKQQKELRRKVQELKQASHESNQQKVEALVKKPPIAPKSSSPRTVNHTKKTVPSPAHSASTMAISPKSFPQKPNHNICIEDDANMSVPLDLCVKKQEPTFEVTTSSILSSPHIAIANMAKKQLQTMTFSQQSSNKLQTSGPKRRGRKPKALSASNILPPVTAHQLKQNNFKDFDCMLLPQKLWVPPTTSIKNSDISSQKKSTINSINPSKSIPLMPNDLSSSILTPRKNFTLDSLLSESNGTLDFSSSPNSIDIPVLSLGSKAKNKERIRCSNKMKKIDEKCKDVDLSSKHESSSGTDSDLDNDHSDSEESSIGNNSTSASHKRSYDEDREEFSNKKRRIVPDEREVQIPLEHGWRRETKIQCFSRSGVRGEVTYYSPCGKAFHSYPEVAKHLIKNNITDISKDNFTFSTKVIVGEFLECTSIGTGEGYVQLSESEVIVRLNELKSRKSRTNNQNKKLQQPKTTEQEEQQRLWEQKQLQHQFEQQELSRQARAAKLMRQHQREQALIAARNERKLKAEEVRRQKEQQRILKQQERFERMEQLRIEREIRTQQLLEEQEIKRQQQAFLREQERERRRQHMILVRALETRKKQEERERKREEMLYEKRISKEKKMEQKRIELDYL